MIPFFTRKIIHLFFSIIPLSYIFLDRKIILLLTTSLSGIFLIIEFMRFKIPKFKKLFKGIFGKMLKNEEEERITGATWLMLSFTLCILIFKKEIAILSLLFMTISDTIASIGGKLFGRHKIMNKTLEGSILFLVSAFIITIFFKINIHLKLFSSFAGTIAEIIPSPLDDNLFVPLVVGGLLEILT